jgi:hypothetical protein
MPTIVINTITQLDVNDQEVQYFAVMIPLTEVRDLLSRYTPSSGSSPSAADCRGLTRALLDAAIASGVTP